MVGRTSLFARTFDCAHFVRCALLTLDTLSDAALRAARSGAAHTANRAFRGWAVLCLAGCDMWNADFDGDGVLPASFGGEDCDNRNPDVPGPTELCNGYDDDCDGDVDEGDAADAGSFWQDRDGDGYGPILSG